MTFWLWSGFLLLILGLLALDLGIFHRRPEVMRVREALIWTAVWVTLALLFGLFVWFVYDRRLLGAGAGDPRPGRGTRALLEFLTGYIVEKSLSLDNVFVIALIFSHFRVRPEVQHRLLFWGVLGALILRGFMIGAGAALLAHFAWVTYLFGAILLLTAAKLLLARHEEFQPERNLIFRVVKRFVPVSPGYDGDRLLTRLPDGRKAITLLGLVLVVIESSDVLFAVDSIPAIFSITRDPFLVFTSNVFAILGLRSLFFALIGVLDRFRYMKTSLVYVLSFIGVKMILAEHHEIPVGATLGVICGILLTGALASIGAERREARRPPP